MKKVKEKKADYEILLSIVIFILIVYFFTRWEGLLYFALGLGVLVLLSKYLGGWVTYIWQSFLRLLGFINAHILLSVIFFLILFPIATLAKLFGKKSLSKKLQAASFYKERKHEYGSDDFVNMW